MSRIPFVAAVVGALLIGGATTGGTHAKWVNSQNLAASSTSTGSMNFTLGSPTTLPALDKVGTSEGQATFVATDTSVGKTLVQRITATIGTTPTGVNAFVATGATCAGITTTSAFVDKSPSDATRTQTYCVRVVSSSTAVSGNVTLNLTGAQRPTGWSIAAKTVTIPVTINSGAILTCGTQTTKDQFPITWTNPSGATASVVQLKDTNGTFNDVANTSAAGSPRTYTVTQNSAGSWVYRIKFTGGSTAVSNTVTVTHDNNNGNSNMGCS